MVRNKTKKTNDAELKKPHGRKQQIKQTIEPAPDSITKTPNPYSSIFNSMMPMIMMTMMFAILTPMLKGLAQNEEEDRQQTP